MRPLPRRTNIHRYPGLSWFAGFARKRAYLWSFRTSAMQPALWAGSILTFMPVVGIQIPLACGLAILLRANLPTLIGLQFITNAATLLPSYFICFQVGHLFLKLIGIDTEPLSIAELREVVESFREGDWASNFHFFGQAFGIISLGALIIGTFVGAVLSTTYRLLATRATSTFGRIRELQRLHREQHVRSQRPVISSNRRFFRKGRRWK